MNAVDQLTEKLKPLVAEELLKITQVPRASVFASTTNPRKNFDSAAMQELIASVRLHGVLQPILVRPMQQDEWLKISKPAYEIVAGERRWRAARAAGLETIDVKVRDLSDREVLELQIIENLQRADLHPLEEADGYGRMMTGYGYTAADLAAKIGKSRAYIYGRLKLRDLSGEARSAFYDGRLSASVALLVARVPTSRLQSELLRELLDQEEGTGEPASVRDVQETVRHRYMLDLARAPFPTDCTTLIPTAGSCYDCPKRTGNQPEIFDDVSDADVCTDTTCFGAKKLAHSARLAAEARAKGLAVIAGEDAKKVAPYGVNDYLSSVPDAYVAVDAAYHGGENPGQTFRQLLGDALKITLVEDPRSGVLVESMPATAMRDALIAAGVIAGAGPDEQSKWEADRKKTAEKVASEMAFRSRLWERVKAKAETVITNHWPSPMLSMLDRVIVVRLWDMASTDCKQRMTKDVPGKTLAEKLHAMRERILIADRTELFVRALEIATSSDMYVNEYTLGGEPRTLTDAAFALGILPTHVRKEMAEGKALKPRKTTIENLAEESAAKIKRKGKDETKPAKPETAAGEELPIPSLPSRA